MTVIRKREGDKGGCCNPYSELQLEIERVDQTAIDAKTTANDTEAYLNTINGKVNEAIAVVPQVQTNTEAIAAHGAELTDHDARIHTNTIVNDQQNTDIAALKTKTNDNAAAIETLEDEVGPETVAGTIQYRLKDIDTKLPTAIKEVEMIADASTVTHKSTHISGTTESDALPVVSREQAGIMSASVYAAMEDVIANNTSRISVLEQSAPTYDISGLVGPNPTNAEISAAFTQKYPNVPIQAGLRAADYDNAHFWQYGKNTWIMLTQIDVQMATNQSLGIVKGSNTDGKVFIETDGSMSLKGYDTLVSKDATHDSKISTLETGLGDANARIDATNNNVANNAADIVAANGNISTNTNDINGLKGRMATAEGQIATHETKINQHTQSINGLSTEINGLTTDVNGLKTDVNGLTTDVNGLTTDVNGLKTDVNGLTTDVNGLTTDVNGLNDRMVAAEGQIATHETKINQHTQSINGLTTDVNGLKTSKQDKLIAGSNITIGADGKTISADSYVPVTRVVNGRESVLSEFKFFMANGKIGDTLRIECRWEKDNIVMWGPPVSNSYNEPTIVLGDYNQVTNEEYIKIQPYSEIEVISEDIYNNNTYKTISFEGKCYIQESGGSETDNVGLWNISYNVAQNVDTISYYGAMYVPLAFNYPTLYAIKKSGVNIGIKEYDPVYDLKAIANYERK